MSRIGNYEIEISRCRVGYRITLKERLSPPADWIRLECDARFALTRRCAQRKARRLLGRELRRAGAL